MSDSKLPYVDVKVGDFSAHLRLIKEQVAKMSGAGLDRSQLLGQIDGLLNKYANLPASTLMSLAQVEADLLKSLQAINSASLIDTLAPGVYSSKSLPLLRGVTASTVEKVDKAINNTAYLLEGLRKNWGGFSSSLNSGVKNLGIVYFTDDSWLENAALGKKGVDAFRKGMIYSLQLIENARNLSAMSHFTDGAEAEAKIAKFILDVSKNVTRYAQLSVMAVQEYMTVELGIDSKSPEYKATEKYTSRLELGYRLFSIGSSVADILVNAKSGKLNDYVIAKNSISLANDLIDTLIVISKMFSGGKNFQASAGAVSGMLGLGPQLIGLVKAISDLQKAPEGLEIHYINEALYQSFNMVLGVVIGSMTTYAAITAKTVSSAVPVLGVIASLASAFSPLDLAGFDAKQQYIDEVKEREAYETSATYLIELLESFQKIDIGYFAMDKMVSVSSGIASSAAIAAGPYAIPLSLGIAAISTAFNV